MIYVPDYENYSCIVLNNENVLRAYHTMPTHNSTINYTDFYFNSNYLYKEGQQTFSQYSTLPTCLDSDVLTDNYVYRLDFPNILLMFFIISIFVVYLPYRIFSRFFGRWLKC